MQFNFGLEFDFNTIKYTDSAYEIGKMPEKQFILLYMVEQNICCLYVLVCKMLPSYSIRQQAEEELAGGRLRSAQRLMASLPADDLTRSLTVTGADETKPLIHVGLAGDTYTILVRGSDTGGRFCVIDMHVPPGGGAR